MFLNNLDSDFLRYLVTQQIPAGQRLPTLQAIGQELGISVGKLREQLEVARSLGLVSVRPRLGIQREPFDFSQAILTSLLFGLGTGEVNFAQFSQLRQSLESSFWHEAVTQLTLDDKTALKNIIVAAWSKLRGDPIHVPNGEHRNLHLTIFRRLDNPFVKGVLEAYWEAYEASELTRYSPYEYWLDVWDYHEQIVTALCENDFARGQHLLVEHFSLLSVSPKVSAQK